VVVVRREGATFLASLLLSFSPLFFSSIVLADAGLLRAPIFAFPYLCSTSTFPKPFFGTWFTPVEIISIFTYRNRQSNT